MRGEHALRDDEREIREMLVIDRVELVFLHQPQQVRELHRDHAAGLEQQAHAAHEVVQVGHVREHVVAGNQVRLAARGRELAGGLGAEELHQRGHALFLRDRGDVRRRLDAEHRHALRDEVLQQVAVVARDLDHEARGAESEARHHRLGIGLGVREPRVRVGGEVGVVAEDLLRRLELLQLHQEALLAHPGVQRIEALHAVEVSRLEVRVRGRRHAEIGKGQLERGAAEAAGGWRHRPASSM